MGKRVLEPFQSLCTPRDVCSLVPTWHRILVVADHGFQGGEQLREFIVLIASFIMPLMINVKDAYPKQWRHKGRRQRFKDAEFAFVSTDITRWWRG
jgi:hypothetical protein